MMPFENFTNPFQNPANVPAKYRTHPRLSKLFQPDGTYTRPMEDPVTLWAVDLLHRNYEVPLESMELEISVDFSEGTHQNGRRYMARVDLVIYDDRYKDARGNLDVAFIALEAMEPGIDLDSTGGDQSGVGHFNRLNAYVSASASVRYAILTNGLNTRIYRRDFEYPRALQPVGDLPKYESAAEAAKHSPYTVVLNNDLPDGIETGLTPLTRDKFREVLGDTRSGCHSILRDNEGLQPQEAVDAMVKFLFAKWYDEQATIDLAKQTGESRAYVFSVSPSTDPERLLVQVSETFEQAKKWEQENLRKKYGDNVAVRMAFKDTDALMFKPHTTMEIVKRLQPYSLRRSSADIKGGVFEDFLGKTFRDDLGQYFTPTPVINLIVGILQPTVNDFIGDPACGSARMLTHALDYVRKQEYHKAILANGNSPDGINPEEPTAEFVRFRDNQLFGAELAPNVMHIARVNTLMNGAQYADLKVIDSLAPLASITGNENHGLPENPGFYPGGLSLIITNPPFGAKVTDKRILDDFASRNGISKLNGKVAKSLLQELAFINRCLEYLAPGGRLGIVLTDGALANDTSQIARNWILQQAKLLAVISLPQPTFAPYGSGVKTSVMFLEKRIKPIQFEKTVDLQKELEKIENDQDVFMAKIENIGYDAAGRLSVFESQANEPPDVIEVITGFKDKNINRIDPEKLKSINSLEELEDIKHFWIKTHEVANNRFDVNRYNRKYIWVVSKLNEKYGDNVVPLRSVTYPITSGSTPLGSAYIEDGVPFLRVQNILPDGSVDLSNCLFVSQEFAKKIQRSAIQTNDVLLVIVGATIGKCAIAKGIEGLVVPNQAIARIRLLEDKGIKPDFLQAFLASEAGQIQINTLKRPVAQGNINLTETGQLLIPILPEEIQNNIIREIEDRRIKAKTLYEQARNMLTEVKDQIEGIVLGIEYGENWK